MLRFFRQRPGCISARQMRQDEAYIFGESQPESNRLDMQHFMFRWEFDGDYSAPIRNPLAILDVACGTGRWVRDVARRLPRATVYGFDMNREQLDRALMESEKRGEPIPLNCTFATGDALQRFNFPDHAFQLVMARANSAYVPIDRWPSLLQEMMRVTAPQGKNS